MNHNLRLSSRQDVELASIRLVREERPFPYKNAAGLVVNTPRLRREARFVVLDRSDKVGALPPPQLALVDHLPAAALLCELVPGICSKAYPRLGQTARRGAA